MNENLKQLVLKAGFDLQEDQNIERIMLFDGGNLMSCPEAEKFAGLIIEECRKVLNEVYHASPLEHAGILLALDENILEHFYGDNPDESNN